MRFLITIFLIFFSFQLKSQQIVEDIGHYTVLNMPIIAGVKTLADRDTQGTIQLLKSFALQTGTTLALKRIINKTRPNGGKYSFPSGHTSLAFMSSTFVWKRYGWEWGVPATALAGFVGYSRAGTEDPVHFWSDVAAGAVLGILSSYVFTTPRARNFQLSLQGNSRSAGFSIKYVFTD